jgi:uncharacterized protein YggE
MAEAQTINIRPPLWLPILAVVIGGAFYVAGKNIEKRPVAATPGIISVSGEGKVTVTPDIAMISFGMQTGRMDTAKAAMAKLSTGMNKVFDAVKNSGVEEKDITTEQFTLNPVYDWTDGGQVFRGFEASQSLRVKVRDLDKVTDVLGAATAAGANQAGNVNFTVDNPEAKQAEARQKAIDQAKEKAKTLAAQLGVQLGDIQNFSEGGGGYPSPVMMRSEYGMGGGVADQKSIPLPSGEQDVTAYVTITYELK